MGDDRWPAYFNRDYETIASSRLEEIELEKFKKQLRYVYEQGPFYRQKFDAAGFRTGMLQRLSDITNVPLTGKDELRISQNEVPPYGDYLCAPVEKLNRIHATSGTSGQPLFVPLTRNDIAMQNEVGARSIWAMGGRPGDICLECASYTLFVGGVSDHMCAETAGVAVIPIGFGNTKLLLEIQQKSRATTIGTIPSYMDHLAEVVRRDLQIEPAELGLRKGVFGGEPGNLERIAVEWKMDARDYYGLSEVACGFGGDCDYKEGIHFLGQGHILAELIDPDTLLPVEIETGAWGELVFTNLDREACPVIRYRTRDTVEILGRTCKCGRTGFRFKFKGRSDDMLLVRGVNVFPAAVREVLMTFHPRLTGNFKVVLEQPGVQFSRPLPLKIEYGEAVKPEQVGALQKEVHDLIHDRLRFTPGINMVPPGTIGTMTGMTGKIDFFERLY
ncbi:MAG: AMP-binding protein [Bacillota bacterium]